MAGGKKTAKGTAKPRVPAGLKYVEQGAIATVTLARPERLNALTFEMYAGLRDLFTWFAARKDLGAIILTGEGRGFCSGGDVEAIIRELLRMNAKELARFTALTNEVVARMRACPQPIIAALNGTVAGAGAALAVASDLRIAVPEARIAFLFVRAGLSAADMGACYRLPRIIGLGRATELLVGGEFIEAHTAQQWGLYNRIVAPELLKEEASTTAGKIANGPTQGIPWSKWTLDAEFSVGLRDALDHDAKTQAKLMKHRDFKEAYQAFAENRPPKFR